MIYGKKFLNLAIDENQYMLLISSEKYSRTLILPLLVIGLSCGVYRSAKAQKLAHAIQFTLFNEAISLPTQSPIWQKGLRWHPGFSVGLNKYYNKKGKNYYYWNFTAQYFYHEFVHGALGFYGSWNYRRVISSSFHLGAELGLGYMHRFSQMKEYRFENGKYDRIRPLGIPGLMFTLGAQMNWYPKNFLNQSSIFLKYQIQGVYRFAGEVPILPFTLTHIGLSYPLKKQEKVEWNDPSKI